MKRLNDSVLQISNMIVWNAQMKAVAAIFTMLIMGGGIYIIENTGTKDPYTTGIEERAQIIDNVVLGVIDAQEKEPAYKFQTTLGSANFIIKMERVKAEQEALKLTPEQRALNEKFRAYLVAANLVVYDIHDGKQANLTAMNEARSAMGV